MIRVHTHTGCHDLPGLPGQTGIWFLSEVSLAQRKCEPPLKLSSACPCFTEERKTTLYNQEWHKCQEMERSSTRVMILLMRHNLTNAQSAPGPLFSTTLLVKPWPSASSTRRVITPERLSQCHWEMLSNIKSVNPLTWPALSDKNASRAGQHHHKLTPLAYSPYSIYFILTYNVVWLKTMKSH